MESDPKVWISERSGKKGLTYHVRWWDTSGSKRSESCGRSRKRAETRANAIRYELLEGKRQTRDKPWAAFVSEELDNATGQMVATSRLKLKDALEALTRLCGPKSVGQVTFGLLERFRTKRLSDDGCSAYTVKGDLSYIRAALNRARERGYIAEVPKMPRLKLPAIVRRVLTVEEIERVIEACEEPVSPKAKPETREQKAKEGDRRRAYFWLCLTLGARKADVLGIRWADVDLDQSIIQIVQQKVQAPVVCYLDPMAVEYLRKLWRHAPKRVQDGRAVPRAEWVFTSDAGNRWGTNLRRTWLGIIKRAKVPHATIQDLRGTFCTGLASANVSAFITSKLAGHSSPNTTAKYYVSVQDEACRQAVARLPWVKSKDANRTQVASETA